MSPPPKIIDVLAQTRVTAESQLADGQLLQVEVNWCNIIVLNTHAPSEEKSDSSNDSFYEELERGFDHFPKYDMKIL